MATAMRKVVILGAAGRDFHDFNVYWRNDPNMEVVAFTAAQIPNIAGRGYPAGLAGPRYPRGVPIYPEEQLDELIGKHGVSLVAMAYSDLPHEEVMHKAARVNAAGADFIMLGHRATMLASRKKVIAVCAVRTGCGKSQTTRAIAHILKKMGKRVAVVRHPMPYGDLEKQVCERLATIADLERYECTIEEREEYEPHIVAGNLVFAGVDYAKILAAAEAEADVILWDGGNNDMPFFRPDLLITVADPHRPGHERRYYPGETNLRMADVVVINKCDTAAAQDVATVVASVRAVNPDAEIVHARSPIQVAEPGRISGKRVLAVEDGPTVTHGEMRYGVATLAAKQFGASELVDPRAYAAGSIATAFAKYRHLTHVLPALGYGRKQVADLEQTINATPCDLVLIGTPIDLGKMLKINKPAMRVGYELEEVEPGRLQAAVEIALRGS